MIVTNNRYVRHFTQRGVALVLLVFMIALSSIAYVINRTTGVEYRAQRDLRTAKALVEAKDALLGWSVLQNNPGQLPCPEDESLIGLPTEGQSQLTCNTLPAIGRLPWKTLGIGDIRDGNDDKLWYVISSGFRASPINLNTVAGLSVNGMPNSAVAIVFSPGAPLSTQNRPIPTASTPPNVTQYLDLSNNDGDSSFVTTGSANVFNDRVLAITQSELFSLVTKRILREVRGDSAQGLVKYYTSHTIYPFADINNDGDFDISQFTGKPTYNGPPSNLQFPSAIKNTLVNNGWFPLIDYVLAADSQHVTLTLNSKSIEVAP